MTISQELQLRGLQYVESRNIQADFTDYVGFGEDGRLWRTSQQTVIKVFERKHSYHTELSCYQRLRDENITQLKGLVIPELVDFDNGLLVIEMTLVVPPWLLDFAK